MRAFFAAVVGQALALFAQFITAVRADWKGAEPVPRQRIYFANHVSNADLPLIWTVMPPAIRRQLRPVAAADYWLKNKVRAFVGPEVFNAVLVDRRAEARTEDPIAAMTKALDEGSSLLIFPEGGRNRSDDPLLPFKAGLYNVARERPRVDLVPTWVDRVSSIMPSGEVIPVPLGCTVTFGAPIHVRGDEDKDSFLARAAAALLECRPPQPDDDGFTSASKVPPPASATDRQPTITDAAPATDPHASADPGHSAAGKARALGALLDTTPHGVSEPERVEVPVPKDGDEPPPQDTDGGQKKPSEGET